MDNSIEQKYTILLKLLINNLENSRLKNQITKKIDQLVHDREKMIKFLNKNYEIIMRKGIFTYILKFDLNILFLLKKEAFDQILKYYNKNKKDFNSIMKALFKSKEEYYILPLVYTSHFDIIYNYVDWNFYITFPLDDVIMRKDMETFNYLLKKYSQYFLEKVFEIINDKFDKLFFLIDWGWFESTYHLQPGYYDRILPHRVVIIENYTRAERNLREELSNEAKRRKLQ